MTIRRLALPRGPGTPQYETFTGDLRFRSFGGSGFGRSVFYGFVFVGIVLLEVVELRVVRRVVGRLGLTDDVKVFLFHDLEVFDLTLTTLEHDHETPGVVRRDNPRHPFLSHDITVIISKLDINVFTYLKVINPGLTPFGPSEPRGLSEFV